MTDKPHNLQATNVVPADDDLVERPYGSGHFALAAPGDSQEDVFLLRFADPDIREQIFMGPDAERSAWAAWNRFAPSYNCYLFRLASLSSELAQCRNALEEARKSLTELANWRKDSAAYTDKMNLPRRRMDEAQVIHMEGLAESAIATIDAALNPIGEEGAREPW